jgi:uncharacterized protein YqkB
MLNMTITVNDPDAERVQAAFGKQLGLAQPATEAEVQAALGSYIQQVTLMQEQAALSQSIQSRVAQIPPVQVV